MGYVYLMEEINDNGKYKIGSTRSKNINTRLKQLQTGNSSELIVRDYFETNYPFKLEKMLHNRFKQNNVIGEWFELNKTIVDDFKGICENLNNILESLKDNPFF